MTAGHNTKADQDQELGEAGATGEIPELPETKVKKNAERSLEVLEDEAYRRAVEGVEIPVFQSGKQVGVKRQWSDRLLVFLLAGLKPAKYGKRRKQEPPELVNDPVYGSFNTHPDLVREYERGAEITQPLWDYWEKRLNFKFDEEGMKKG